MPIRARIRFGALPSAAIPRVYRGDGVDVWCDFTDIITGAPVAVSNVTVTTWLPSGAELSPPIVATQESPGVWRALVTPQFSGTWSIAIQCETPERALHRRDFIVEALAPDTGPAPAPEWPVLEELVAAAEAAKAAAESAAAGANGVLLLAGIAGTSTAYTSTTDVPVVEGLCVRFVPHVDSGAAPTLKLGTQTARSLRFSGTTAATPGMFRAGRTYDLTVRLVGGIPVFASEIENIGYHFGQQNIVSTGGTFLNYWQALTDAAATVRFFFGTDGRLDTFTGTGAAAPTLRTRIEADGKFRAFAGIYDGTLALGEAARVLTENRPPLTYANTKRLAGQPARMNNRTAPQRISVPAGGYYEVGGLDQHRDIIYGNGAWLNFIHAPKGSTFNIIPASSGAVCYLYTGEGEWNGNGVTAATLTPHTWANTGGTFMQGSPGAWLRVRRGNSTFLAIADSGTVSAATLLPNGGGVAMPSADLVIGAGPQSWGVDWRQNSAAGAVPAMATLGLGSKFCSPDTANVGASTLLYFAEKATLFHWDQISDVPGQRLIDIAEAIKADHAKRTTLMGATAPRMQAFRWVFGLNDLQHFGPASTHPHNNPAVYVASFVKACQFLDTENGAPMVHIVTPLTSQKFGTFPQPRWYAMRMAQLRLPAAGAAASPQVKIIIGAEIYGDARSGDEEAGSGERHYDFPTHAVQAERDLMALDNELNVKTNHLGPYITGIATADSGVGREWDVTIEYGTGQLINQATRPDAAGFRLLPAATGNPDVDDFVTETPTDGTGFIQPLPIASTRWVVGTGTTIKLRVTLATPYTGGTPRPCVLWGSAEATEELACLIYTLHPVTGKRYYLRQYLYP
jgi:hypothetical protein